jgi:Protein of unknown function (DUF1266)
MTTSLVSSLIGASVCGILALVVLAIGVGVAVSMRRRARLAANMRAAEQAAPSLIAAASSQASDVAIPLRRFGQCAVFIITGDQDYGYFPAHAPQKMLAASWGIIDADRGRAQITALLGNSSGPDLVAFDAVRAIHLARACAGAGFIPQGESWAYVKRAAAMLQQRFRSWDEVGDAYLAAKNAWLRARDLDTDDGTEAQVARLRREVWPSFPLNTAL